MKWIIVTGDSGGLGSAITKVILEQVVYGVIGISRKKNDNVIFFEENFTNYKHINYDLGDIEGIKDLYKKKIKPIGQLYGLVNNSAMAYDDIVTNATADKLVAMFNINVIASIMLTKYTIRDMLLNGVKGSLVHISSVSAHTGYKGLSMYAATKGAMEAFSKNVAREWGPLGIRSNVVAPGFMETNISSKLTDEQKNKIYQRTSLKKATNIDSVAKTVYFLLSGKAESITGTVVNIDNGTV